MYNGEFQLWKLNSFFDLKTSVRLCKKVGKKKLLFDGKSLDVCLLRYMRLKNIVSFKLIQGRNNANFITK